MRHKSHEPSPASVVEAGTRARILTPTPWEIRHKDTARSIKTALPTRTIRCVAILQSPPRKRAPPDSQKARGKPKTLNPETAASAPPPKSFRKISRLDFRSPLAFYAWVVRGLVCSPTWRCKRLARSSPRTPTSVLSDICPVIPPPSSTYRKRKKKLHVSTAQRLVRFRGQPASIVQSVPYRVPNRTVPGQ